MTLTMFFAARASHLHFHRSVPLQFVCCFILDLMQLKGAANAAIWKYYPLFAIKLFNYENELHFEHHFRCSRSPTWSPWPSPPPSLMHRSPRMMMPSWDYIETRHDRSADRWIAVTRRWDPGLHSLGAGWPLKVAAEEGRRYHDRQFDRKVSPFRFVLRHESVDAMNEEVKWRRRRRTYLEEEEETQMLVMQFNSL